MQRLLPLALVLLLAAPHAFAWGEKGHYLVSEAATHGLPTDMPHFFYHAFPELIWLGYEPDRWRNAGESLEAGNASNHFLDYEYVEGLELPPSRYGYIDLMVTSGRLRKHGISNSEAGFLPWAIAEESQKLVVGFRNWRASRPGSPERAMLERDIIHIAGVLGHYVADGSNPHHATLNYNGWAMPNPNHYAIDCETHSRFESRFVTRAVDLEHVVPKLAPPVLRDDFFAVALEHIKASHALVERLYQLDRDGAFAPVVAVRPEGVAFASDRLAAGASMLRDIWWSAWKKSAERPRRGGSGD